MIFYKQFKFLFVNTKKIGITNSTKLEIDLKIYCDFELNAVVTQYVKQI